jgi:hypothetical protein
MKLIGKYIVIALIAFVLVITPVLQGNQAANNSRESCDCCDCCCGCGEQEAENAQAECEDAGCGCNMTDSEIPVEVPFDGQVQTVNHDSAAELSDQSCSKLRQIRPESNYYSSNDRINEYGPPLYKINSAYLI